MIREGLSFEECFETKNAKELNENAMNYSDDSDYERDINKLSI